MGLKEIGWEAVNWIHLALDSDQSVAGSCEHDNEHSGSIKGGEFHN